MRTQHTFGVLFAAGAVLAVGCGGGGGGGGGGSGGSSTLTDLVVEAVAVGASSAVAGGTLSVSDTVRNLGPRPADDFRIGVYLSSDAAITAQDTLLGFRGLARLDAGSSDTGGGTLTIPVGTAAGTWHVGVRVDDQSAVAERDEANNTRTATTLVSVAVVPLADLEISAVSAAPNALAAGEELEVSDTVTNSGATGAAAFQVGIYLSSDATITAADTLLGLRAVPELARGASSSASDTLLLPASLAPGTWYVGALADVQNAVPESDESDNARSTPTTLTVIGLPRPNLVVQDFSFAPAGVDSGLPIDVADTVANIGPGAALGVEVAVYLSSDAVITAQDTLLGTRTLAALASGASQSSTGTLEVPLELPGGTYFVGALVDPGLDVPETDESDNTRVASGTLVVTVPPRPDLAPTGVSFTPNAVDTTFGEVLHVTESVTNIGVLPSGPFRVGIYLSSNNVVSPSDTLLASREVAGLAVGASSGAVVDVQVPPGVSAGTYYLGTFVDDLGALLELRESNNALLAPATLDVIASPAPLPDLVMQSVGFTPAQVNPGAVVQVQSEVRNQGTLSATSFQVGIYLSTDDQITADDLRIGARQVLQLGIQFGSASSAPFVVPAGLAAGTYHVGALADDASQVAELNEANNGKRASGILTVVIPPPPRPDLVVDAAAFTPGSAAPGQVLQLSTTVRNAGDLGCATFRVAFYASVDATVDTTDLLLGSQLINGLAPAQSFAASFQAALPAGTAPGDYTIAALVDDAAVVDEGDETNNRRVAGGALHVP